MKPLDSDAIAASRAVEAEVLAHLAEPDIQTIWTAWREGNIERSRRQAALDPGEEPYPTPRRAFGLLDW